MSMDWVEEDGRVIYRPIRPLFSAPVYTQTVQICWEKKYYLSQKKMMVHMLRLQQQNPLLSELTAEDMMDLLVEQSKKTLRERLWRFSLEDQDEDVVQPLLMLTWQVNVNMKMRDIEFEARMVLDSPGAHSPHYQEPKIMRLAEEAVKTLVEKHQQECGSSLLGPQEVAMAIVPKVLQGFWPHPPSLSSVMPSMRLSPLAVSVTKAVLDQLSSSMNTMEHQVTFSRLIRDEKALSVQEEVKQKYTPDVLVEELGHFGSDLLSNIIHATVGEISAMFDPQNQAEMLSTKEVEADESCQAAVMADNSLSHEGGVNEEPGLEEETAARPEMDSAVDSTPLGPLPPSAESPAIAAVEEDLTACLDDTEQKELDGSCHTAAEDKKTKKKGVRRFLRWLFKKVFCCKLPKDAE